MYRWSPSFVGTLVLWSVLLTNVQGKDGSRAVDARRVGTHRQPVVAISIVGTLVVSVGRFEGMRVWNIGGTVEDPGKAVRLGSTCVKPCPEMEAAAIGSNDGRLAVVELRSGHVAARMEGHEGPVEAVAVSPDGGFVCSAAGPSLTFLRIGREVRIVSDGVRCLALWDAASGRKIHDFGGYFGAQSCVDFSPDGSLLASSGADGIVHIWNVSTGDERTRLELRDGMVHDVKFIGTDGAEVAAAHASGRVSIWDIGTRTERARHDEHDGSVNALAVVPEHRLFISGGADGTIRVWDMQSGRPLRSLRLDAAVHALALSPDGSTVAVGTGAQFDQGTRSAASNEVLVLELSELRPTR